MIKNGQVIFAETQTNLVKITPQKLKKITDAAYKKGVKDALQKIPTVPEKTIESGLEAGIKQRVQEKTRDEETAKTKSRNLVTREEIILLKATTVFPFDFFPDTIVIDTAKIHIVNKEFFATERVTTINFKDIVDVWAEKSLFLGNLIILYLPKQETMGMLKPLQHRINLLKEKDAMDAKNILKRMLILRREEVDLTQLSPQELKDMLEKIGEQGGETF
jgi:hypothetical protein